MIILKLGIYFLILFCSIKIGKLIASKYDKRVKELKDFYNGLNMFKTKVRYTYEPIPEIFSEISKTIKSNVKGVFKKAIENMQKMPAGKSWELALKSNKEVLEINNEDTEVLISFSKLLGKTDLQGQLNEIELTISFLENQIKKAEDIKAKDEKLYKTLGTIIGIGLVIILL